MAAHLEWAGDEPAPPPSLVRRPLQPGELPAAVQAALWRGHQLGSPVDAVRSTGFAALDAELPGRGWPCHSLTEVLQAQPSIAEWRLLAPTMNQVVADGRDVVIVGPPKTPHLPGLRFAGLDERRLLWLRPETPAERLWVTEQVIKANAAGLLVSWLPQARQEQIRRLQICAQTHDGPVFLCRPAAAEHEPSAAPLRVQLRVGLDWELHLHLLKRKGPTHEGHIVLPSMPGGLESILTPRLRRPSLLIAARKAHEAQEAQPTREVSHAVGSPDPRAAPRRVNAH